MFQRVIPQKFLPKLDSAQLRRSIPFPHGKRLSGLFADGRKEPQWGPASEMIPLSLNGESIFKLSFSRTPFLRFMSQSSIHQLSRVSYGCFDITAMMGVTELVELASAVAPAGREGILSRFPHFPWADFDKL